MKFWTSAIHYILFAAFVALLGYSVSEVGNIKNSTYIPYKSSTLIYSKPSFSFTVAGDYGMTSNTSNVLSLIDSLKADFHLGLGDFVYEKEKYSEEEWCQFIKKNIDIPFEILAGNHDQGGNEGDINKILKCLPNSLPKDIYFKGDYGKEYYFYYPSGSWMSKIILISPGIKFFEEGEYSFKADSPKLKWLKERIDAARDKGTKWIIVGMHKTCLSASGVKSCEIGEDLMDFMIKEKVDLVLSGHEHAYERTHQLKCADFMSYKPECVVEQKNNYYKKGEGTIFTIVGTGGQSNLVSPDPSNPNYHYFAKALGIRDDIYGAMKVSIDEASLKATFFNYKGQVIDSFIVAE